MYTYLGSDLPDTVESGFSQNNVFEANLIEGGPQSIKIKEADGTKIVGNTFIDATRIEWNMSTANVVTSNVGLDEVVEVTLTDSCFDETDVVSLSEVGCS